jgi:hypothetical protein
MKKLLRITGRILVVVVVAGTLAFGTSQAAASPQALISCYELNCVTQPVGFCYLCCGGEGSFCHRNSGVCVCESF